MRYFGTPALVSLVHMLHRLEGGAYHSAWQVYMALAITPQRSEIRVKRVVVTYLP